MHMHLYFRNTPSRIEEQPGIALRSGQVWLMSFSAAIMVANIYYIQPLLYAMAKDFRITVAAAGLIAMLSQLGTALGMLFFVPLGDNKERRWLIVRLILGACLCLILMAIAQNVWWLALASLGVGLTGSIVHVVIPFAAHLASPAERGATVGKVLSGLLLGILLARTFSGLIGAWLGWRAIYWIAAALMLLTAALFHRGLPKSGPVVTLSWFALLQSAGTLIRTQPKLREAAMMGAVFFASFSAFWTTLVFFLQTRPYHYGSGVAGLFGLVGAVGALGAPLIGRFADRYGARRNVLFALLVTLVSFAVMGLVGRHLSGLIVGVILMDFGVQTGHVSNQTRIYALVPEARSRLNMVYMICYFVAGAIGSYVGTLMWQRFGWTGVCGLGIGLLCFGCGIHIVTGRNKRGAVDEQLV
jgi:predicted MFS family arabinose efflux permease